MKCGKKVQLQRNDPVIGDSRSKNILSERPINFRLDIEEDFENQSNRDFA